MLSPAHPGDFVKHEIIEAHGLTVTAGAKALELRGHNTHLFVTTNKLLRRSAIPHANPCRA